VWSVDDGILTVPGEAACGDVERAAAPWLFASDRPDLTVAEWIGRGGGDLLWGLLGATRSQVLGVKVRLPNGSVATFGGRVVKNVAGYDLARVFCGARGELGEVLEAHLRVRPPPRGWCAALGKNTPREEAGGCSVWTGDTVRFLRKGETAPAGYEPLDPLEARALLRPAWKTVRSFHPESPGTVREGVYLPVPGVVGSTEPPDPERGPLFERLKQAWS
jgi:FAD/FMN-containing dehydrogenase